MAERAATAAPLRETPLGRRPPLRIKIPIPAVLVTLTSPEAGLEERVDAVKTLLALVGQILGVLIAVSALWKLLVAVAGVVGMVVWPLVAPFKLIWWVLAG